MTNQSLSKDIPKESRPMSPNEWLQKRLEKKGYSASYPERWVESAVDILDLYAEWLQEFTPNAKQEIANVQQTASSLNWWLDEEGDA